jgi:hypothetical protein
MPHTKWFAHADLTRFVGGPFTSPDWEPQAWIFFITCICTGGNCAGHRADLVIPLAPEGQQTILDVEHL